MNDDLISRSALKAAIEKEIWISDSTKAVFRNILANVPAVDAETVWEQMGLVKEAFEMAKADLVAVRHGRWSLAEDGDGAVCSCCGKDFCNLVYETDDFNYCPNCGAKMDGGSHD